MMTFMQSFACERASYSAKVRSMQALGMLRTGGSWAWCRDEASGIARAWREGREFGHDVAAVWAEAV